MAKAKIEPLITDPDVPGLVRPSAKIVRETRLGDWHYQLLADGTLFVSHWRGDCMVGHTLYDAEDVEALVGVLVP